MAAPAVLSASGGEIRQRQRQQQPSQLDTDTYTTSSPSPASYSPGLSSPSTPSFEPNASPLRIRPSEITLSKLREASSASASSSSLRPQVHPGQKTALGGTTISKEGDGGEDGGDGLDLDLPISTLLRIGTRRAHVEAENSDGAAGLIKGELELREYVRWLVILWRVYDALELALAEHSSNPVLASIYDPSLLARAPALADDITHLLTLIPDSASHNVQDGVGDDDTTQTPNISETTPSSPLPPFPLPTFLQSLFTHPPPALRAYLDQLHHLSRAPSPAPSLLLAHAYVRYLGDLSGGQIIGGRIKRAYELSGLDGTKFYDFSNRGERSGFESLGGDEKMGKKRMVEIKDWFRRGMDDGVGDDPELKSLLIQEANLSFSLNTHLFSLIRAPSSSSSHSANDAKQLVTTSADSAGQDTNQTGGTELRYYEKRALNAKSGALVSNSTQVITPNTWWERLDRFVTFMASAMFSLGAIWLVQNVLIPEGKARGYLG